MTNLSQMYLTPARMFNFPPSEVSCICYVDNGVRSTAVHIDGSIFLDLWTTVIHLFKYPTNILRTTSRCQRIKNITILIFFHALRLHLVTLLLVDAQIAQMLASKINGYNRAKKYLD